MGLTQITELCMSVSLNNGNTTLTLQNIHSLVPNLKKLCLVIRISGNEETELKKFREVVRSILILTRCNDLIFFQILFLIEANNYEQNKEDNFCMDRINISTQMIKLLTKSLVYIRSNFKNRNLLFKIHLKMCHSKATVKCSISAYESGAEIQNFADAINQLLLRYLLTVPLGKIQFKLTYDAENHNGFEGMEYCLICLDKYMKGLDDLFRVARKKGGCLNVEDKDVVRDEIDFYKVYAMSASKMDLGDKNVHHENKWIADCKWCCNTPWV